MRNLKYYLMLGIVAMLASCSQNEEALQVGNNEAEARVTFRLTANDGPQTRAAVEGLARYCIEVYAKGDTAAAPIYKVYDNTNGQFDVYLRENQTPATILFWADYGDTYYDVSAGLKQISMKDAAAAATSDDKSEAFFHKLTGLELSAGETQVNTSISLKRAVAKVVLTETIGLDSKSPLDVIFEHYPQFNAAAETTIAGTATSRTVIFENRAGISAGQEIGSFIAFAPKAEKAVADFTFKYNYGSGRKLTNVPLQANYQTRITGKFNPAVNQQFIVTTDESWNTPDHAGSWLKVGDNYTHMANGQDYDCIVVSAGYSKAAVAYKTCMPGSPLNLDSYQDCKQYAETLADCKVLGGRFPTQEEFKILNANGCVSSTAAYYAIDNTVSGGYDCAHMNYGNLNFVPSIDHKLFYYLVFDIEKDNQ